jgi:hypothetical protein
MSGPAVDLTLDELVVSPSILRVTYTLSNDESETAFAVNRLFERTAEGFVVGTDVVYASLDGDCLIIRKHLVEVPDEIDVEAPEVPYVTAIPAGKAMSETIRLSVPVILRDPYRRPEASAASRLRLAVGVVVAPDREPRAVGGELRLAYRDVVRGQHVLESPLVELESTVQTVSPPSR